MNRHSENASRFLICLAAIFLVASCATYPPNTSISKRELDKGYRFDTLAKGNNSEDLFVILTFSGGGTRAAALSYGVMEKLKATQITWNGEQKSLLDEVDVISSVSGGSFTSAFYGLFRDKLFSRGPEGFEQRFLYRELQTELELMMFNPINWIKLASPTFGRIDLAAEIYNETIFENKSFTDLKDQGLPFLVINSTDMSAGSQFSFIQSQFDFLCSTLSDFKVGRAAAASSDFPVAFTPLQINNYSDECPYPKSKWVTQAERDGKFSANPGRYQRAETQWGYRNIVKRPYIHLLDGGIADNIGLRGPLASMTSNDISWSLVNKINNGKIKKLVVIVVDAKTAPILTYDKSPSPPNVFKVLEAVSTVPLDNYSMDTIELLKDDVKEWQKARQNLWKNPKTTFEHCPPAPDNAKPTSLKPLDLYTIYIGFDQIDDDTLSFPDSPDRIPATADQKVPGSENSSGMQSLTSNYLHWKEWYLNLPTSFQLKPDTINNLRWVSKHLMDNSKSFQGLTKCLSMQNLSPPH